MLDALHTQKLAGAFTSHHSPRAYKVMVISGISLCVFRRASSLHLNRCRSERL